MRCWRGRTAAAVCAWRTTNVRTSIVLDLMMPMMNGHEVLQILADDPDTAQIPVVILTAVTSPEVHRACLDEGAVKVVTKPYDPEEFAADLDGVIAARATA